MANPKKILAFDIDEGQIALLELSGKSGSLGVDAIQLFSALSQIRPFHLKDSVTILTIPARDIFIRSFSLPASGILKDKSKLSSWLEKQSIPFKLESCYYDTFALGDYLNFMAVKKELLQQRLTLVSGSALIPEVVTASFLAVYNVFVYNYPEEREEFSVINIRNTYTEILLYEGKRFWFYALSSGSQRLEASLEDFNSEVLRSYESHYLQNPAFRASLKRVYITGKIKDGLCESLSRVLKRDCFPLEPLKKISSTPAALKQKNESLAMLSLSLGCGLGVIYPKNNFVSANLIGEKLVKEKGAYRKESLKKFGFISLVVFAVLFVYLNLDAAIRIIRGNVFIKDSQAILKSVLPQTEVLKNRIDSLNKLNILLNGKLKQHKIWLGVFARIAESKPYDVDLLDIDGKKEAEGYVINISARAKSYPQINDFLSALKKDKRIKNIKVLSTADVAAQGQAIDFKMRVEVVDQEKSAAN